VYVLVGLATFSPWFIRNTAWTGNPAFPELTDVFGRAHFSERQVERWNRAHSPRPDQQSQGARLSEFARQVLIDWRFGFALLPLALVAAALSWRDRDSISLQVILMLLALFWLGLTHLQGRFFVLAIPIAALLAGRVANTRFTTGAAVILSLAAVVGVVMVQAKLRAAPGLVDVLGADSIIGATPLAGAPVSADDHVALVGEAKGFFYDLVPSQRLHYRTVFDVDVEPGESSVDAWLKGLSAPPGKTIVVIDPSELTRFSRTYWQIPPPPEDVARSDAPVVIRK
jgi:hypothetical protein